MSVFNHIIYRFLLGKLSLIIGDEECDPKFVSFIRSVSRQIVFLFSDAELVAKNFNPKDFFIDLFMCHSAKHLGEFFLLVFYMASF